MPKRIQRTRAKGWRKPHGAVYVGRGSKWGNPATIRKTEMYDGRATLHTVTYSSEIEHSISSVTTVNERAAHQTAVDYYRQHISETGLADEIRRELAGKDLMCWCPLDTPCHADVLLEIANGEEQ